MQLRRRRSRERGVVLIVVAVAMAAIFVLAAIALDLSNVRNTRQENKSVADLAVAAGLSGLTTVNGVPVEDAGPRAWSGVCAALSYLEANQPDLTLTVTYHDGAGTSVPGNPCASTSFLNAPCVPGVATSYAWIHATDGTFAADIKSGYALPDAAFPEDASDYAGDDGDTLQLGCDQLAVIIEDEDPAFFGVVAGRDDYATTQRSVGRLDIGTSVPVAIALVLLEQEDCQALNFQGGAGGTGRVLVRGTLDEPGIIHSDSSGDGDGCGVGGAAVIAGKNNGGVPLVRVLSAPSNPNEHGILSTYAHALGQTNGASWTSTRSNTATEVWMCDPDHPTGDGAPVLSCTTGPTGGDRVTRTPADDRYLDGVTALRTAANGVFGQIAAGDVPAGYTAYQSLGIDDCALEGGGGGVRTIGPAQVPSGRLYIDCDHLEVKNSWTMVIEDGIDHVVFRGGLSFAGTGTLDIREPERVLFHNGAPIAPAIRVTANASFRVNADGHASCTTRQAAEPDRTTELVIRTGALEVQGGGDLQLCGTFVHLMGGDASPAPVSTAAASYPAPSGNSQNGSFDIAGGGTVEWTAPNADVDSPPTAGSYEFEDLAVWTEAQADSFLRGGGNMLLSGVFFLPNVGPSSGVGGLTVTGDSGGVINFDAQLWARKVSHQGGASFVMRSNPDDSIPLPLFEGMALVR